MKKSANTTNDEIKTSFSPADHLYEDYVIESLSNRLIDIKNNPTRINRERHLEHIYINSQFTVRRLKDIGFHKYISEAIVKNQSFWKEAQKFIKHQIITRLWNKTKFINKIRNCRTNFISYPQKRINITNTNIIHNTQDYAGSILESLAYLDNIIDQAKLDQNLELLKSAELLKEEFATGKVVIDNLIYTEYSQNAFTPQYGTILKKKWETILSYNPMSYFKLNNVIRSDIHSLFNNVYRHIITEISTILDIPIEKAMMFNKFAKDLIIVLQNLWFETKSRKQKWNILNHSYPYQISQKDLNDIVNFTFEYDIKEWINEIETNFGTNFIDQIKKKIENDSELQYTLEYYEKNTAYKQIDTDFMKKYHFVVKIFSEFSKMHFFNVAIACAKFLARRLENEQIPKWEYKKNLHYIKTNEAWLYYQQGKYRKALRTYDEALSCKYPESNFFDGIALKCQAECYYYLDDQIKSKLKLQNFKKTIEREKDLDIKNSLNWNLANLYRRTHQFTKEFKLLLELSVEKETDEKLKDHIFNRINQIEKFVDKDAYSKIFSIYLAKIEDERRLAISIKDFMFHIETFNIKEAKISYKKIISEFDLNEHIFYFGLQFFSGIHELKYFWNLVNKELSKIHQSNIYREVLDLIVNQNFQTSYLKTHFSEYDAVSKKFHPFLNEIIRIEDTNDLEVIFNILIQSDLSEKLISKFLLDIGQSVNPEKQLGYYFDLGINFTNIGFFELGRTFYNQISVNNLNQKEKANLFHNLGFNFKKEDNFKKAEKYLLKAYALDNGNPVILSGLYQYYKELGKFEQARKYLHLLYELNPSDSLKVKEKYLDHLESSYINPSRFKSKKARAFIESANYLKSYLLESGQNIDFSIILINYGKAIETLLNSEISQKVVFPDEIKGIYSRNRIKNDIYKQLTPSLKSLLSKPAKNVTLGQWYYVFKDSVDMNEQKIEKVPYYKYLLNRIKDTWNEEERKKMSKYCRDLADYRNPSAHQLYGTPEEIHDLIPPVINLINKILAFI